jgi:hypothetical protein
VGNEEVRIPGTSVRVRPGVKDPEYDYFSMEGWQGIVIEYIKNDPGELEEVEEWVHEESVLIRWDSVTLAEMPPKMIEECLDDGLDFETICLGIEDVEPAEPRDKPGDAKARATALRDEYDYITFEEQEQNITAILGSKKLKVTETTHNRFLEYLDKNIKYPCILTGMDDLSWKEPDLSGFFSQKEYSELKKIITSFPSRYKLKSLEGIDDLRGILVKVKRIGDKKTFILPLWDLKTAERKDPNHQMIDDYSYWMSNYR